MAAYRFFNNDKVGFESVLHSHLEATGRRMAEQPVVILEQDTTEIDLSRPQKQVKGAGPLDCDSRRGVLLHPLMGFTPDGTPLGIAYAEAWVCDDESSKPKSPRARELQRRQTPIEEKESLRWLDSYRQACELSHQIPETQFVCVADSEADIYELLDESQDYPQPDWIVRACHNFTIPTNAVAGTSYARLRISSAGSLLLTGLASDGEVEDHQVQIVAGPDNLGMYDLELFHLDTTGNGVWDGVAGGGSNGPTDRGPS